MLDEPEHIRAVPIASLTKEQRDNFEDREPTLEAWPEVGSRMMTRVLTGQDLEGPWIIVQEGVYRYSVAQRGGMLVRSVLSEYLATEVFWGG